MHIRLESLSAPRFELELPRPDGSARGLVLESVAGLAGGLEVTPEHVRLISATLESCRVAGVVWPLGLGRMASSTPAVLADVAVDGAIARGRAEHPVDGRASVGRLEASELAADVGDVHLTLDVDARAVAATSRVAPGGSAVAITAGVLSLAHVQAALTDLLGRVGSARVDGVRVHWQPGHHPLSVHADAGVLEEVSLASSRVNVRAGRVALDQGLEVAEGVLHIRELGVDRLSLELPDLGALRAGDPASQPATDTDAQAPARPGDLRLGDLRLLDRISGKVSADVTVDARVLKLGRRRATHKLRVVVDRGTFDIRELERGLAALEDSILDFEVRDGKLILERDVPLIGLRKDLVCWPIAPEDMPMARKGRVRLRILPGYTVLATSPSKKLEFQSLSVDGIDTELRVDEPEECGPELDSVLRELTVGACRIQGGLSYPDTQPRSVGIEAQSVSARLVGLPVGPGLVAHGRVAVDTVSVRVGFAGLVPRSATVELGGVRLGDLVIEPRPAAPA